MIVSAMSQQECLELLAKARHARLACAADNQPYVVPMFLAYYHRPSGEDYLYGFTTFGQKVEWMRANPRVCVEVDDVASRSEWASVVAVGSFEELPNIHEPSVGRAPCRSVPAESHGVAHESEHVNEQLLAHRLLKARGMWWEPAATLRTSVSNDQSNRIVPVFFKIHLTTITGFRARHESANATLETPSAPDDQSNPGGWVRRAMAIWRNRGPVIN